MSSPATRAQFVDYCKRRLGHPVIEINVDDDQVDDRVDDALQFFQDYHFDGVEKLYFKHQMTQQDRDRRFIFIPDHIIGVTGILPFDDSSASINMFDLRYQLRLHDLYDFTSISYVSYTITMQHLRTLNLLFSGTPQFRFQRHKNRLYLDVNWDQDLATSSYIIIECYGKIIPEQLNLVGTFSVTAGSNVVVGTGTTLDAEVIKDEEIHFLTANNGGEVVATVTGISSNVTMNTNVTFANTESNISAFLAGNSDVWNDRVLKDLGTLYIKRQWGENLLKFGQVQLPGGVVLNGQIIYDQAVTELEKMKAEFITYNTLQSDFLLG